MIAEPFDLIDCFLPDILLERQVAGNHVAAESKFLPDHQAQLIANIVKIVGLVVATAPFAKHVHVRIASSLKNFAMNPGSHTVGETVERNDISSFGEHFDAVHHKLET